MPRVLKLFSAVPDEDVEPLRSRYVDDAHFDTLIRGEDVDVLKPDGSPLLMFRHRAIPGNVCARAYPALQRAAVASTNRGDAAGGMRQRVKLDGTISRTQQSPPILSGVMGMFDRTVRLPYCRTTAYTARDVDGWRASLPFIRAAHAVYRDSRAAQYLVQRLIVNRTERDWIIPGTVFSTVTVNRNWRTAVHRDEGDWPDGFGVMSALSAGRYDGCFLVFPKYRVAVDMRTQDVLLADVHELHGNTPFVGTAGEYDRISTVLYYRRNLRYCGTAAEELEKVKRRRPGDRLT